MCLSTVLSLVIYLSAVRVFKLFLIATSVLNYILSLNSFRYICFLSNFVKSRHCPNNVICVASERGFSLTSISEFLLICVLQRKHNLVWVVVLSADISLYYTVNSFECSQFVLLNSEILITEMFESTSFQWPFLLSLIWALWYYSHAFPLLLFLMLKFWIVFLSSFI